jgi:hypothetical protein
MTTEGDGGRPSWLDGAAVGRASDIALGGMLAAAGAVAMASEGSPFSRRDGLDGWVYPAAVGALLVIAGAVLVIRGGLVARHPLARWRLQDLLIITSTMAVAALAVWQWGGALRLVFGPPEFTALIAFELAVAIALARMSRTRAVGMVLLGLLLATIGTDLSTGSPRFTMGLDELLDGISLFVAALGLTVVADGAICLLSPALFLRIYARQVAGWASPELPMIADLAMRVAAGLAIAAACFGAFSLNGATWDIGVLVVFGVFGVACRIFGWNRLVLMLAFAYGALLEENIRRGLLVSRGDPAIFLRWPFSAILLLLAGGTLALVALLSARRSLIGRRST